MKSVDIDVGKNKHYLYIMDKYTDELEVKPVSFNNDKDGFDFLFQKLKSYK